MIQIRSFNEKKLVVEDSALTMAALFWLLFGFMTVLFALWLLTGQSPVPRNPVSSGLAIIAVGIVGALVGASFTHVRRITFDRPADTLVIEDGSWLKVRFVRKYQLRQIELAKLTTKTEIVATKPPHSQSSLGSRGRRAPERNHAGGWTHQRNLYGVALQMSDDAGLTELSLSYGAWENAQMVINAINEIMLWERYANSDIMYPLDEDVEADAPPTKHKLFK